MPKTFHHNSGSPLNGPTPFNPFATKGKIMRGSVAAKSKNFSEGYKVNELIKIIEDKDEIIQRLRSDVQKLKNDTLIIKDSSMLNDANLLNNPVKLQNPNISNMNMVNSVEEELI